MVYFIWNVFLDSSETIIEEYYDLRMASKPSELIADNSKKIANIINLRKPKFDLSIIKEIQIMSELVDEISLNQLKSYLI